MLGRGRRMPYLLALLLALLVTGCASRGAEPPPLSAEDVERIVRDYLTRNPEVVVEAIQAARERQRADQQARVRATILERQAELLRDPMSPVAGNPQGDVTVVEFLDYN